MKAVRYIHPDKLSSALDLESKLIAAEAFICITEAFNKYKKKRGL